MDGVAGIFLSVALYTKGRSLQIHNAGVDFKLMFGRERSLLNALPYYHLDYQEQLSGNPEQRWTYRLTIDGKWEPNLFNFYYRIYARLVADIDIPFQLDNDAIRKGETHVHEALREALVNALVHVDHLSSRPIVIIRCPDVFLFQNPGRLRIPLHRLYEGGVSDPRNPNLQKRIIGGSLSSTTKSSVTGL